VNIEAQHEHLQEQEQMITALIEILTSKKPESLLAN
jgi:hypothetical protein